MLMGFLTSLCNSETEFKMTCFSGEMAIMLANKYIGFFVGAAILIWFG